MKKLQVYFAKMAIILNQFPVKYFFLITLNGNYFKFSRNAIVIAELVKVQLKLNALHVRLIDIIMILLINVLLHAHMGLKLVDRLQ